MKTSLIAEIPRENEQEFFSRLYCETTRSELFEGWLEWLRPTSIENLISDSDIAAKNLLALSNEELLENYLIPIFINKISQIKIKDLDRIKKLLVSAKRKEDFLFSIKLDQLIELFLNENLESEAVIKTVEMWVDVAYDLCWYPGDVCEIAKSILKAINPKFSALFKEARFPKQLAVIKNKIDEINKTFFYKEDDYLAVIAIERASRLYWLEASDGSDSEEVDNQKNIINLEYFRKRIAFQSRNSANIKLGSLNAAINEKLEKIVTESKREDNLPKGNKARSDKLEIGMQSIINRYEQIYDIIEACRQQCLRQCQQEEKLWASAEKTQKNSRACFSFFNREKNNKEKFSKNKDFYANIVRRMVNFQYTMGLADNEPIMFTSLIINILNGKSKDFPEMFLTILKKRLAEIPVDELSFLGKQMNLIYNNKFDLPNAPSPVPSLNTDSDSSDDDDESLLDSAEEELESDPDSRSESESDVSSSFRLPPCHEGTKPTMDVSRNFRFSNTNLVVTSSKVKFDTAKNWYESTLNHGR